MHLCFSSLPLLQCCNTCIMFIVLNFFLSISCSNISIATKSRGSRKMACRQKNDSNRILLSIIDTDSGCILSAFLLIQNFMAKLNTLLYLNHCP